MAKPGFRHSNPGWAEELKKRLNMFRGKEIAAGYPRGAPGTAATYDNGATVLEVAAWNQFGTKTAPARPFMDTAARRMEEDVKPVALEAAKKVFAGESFGRAFREVGAAAEGAVKSAITDGVYEPNAPATVYRSLIKLKGYRKAAVHGKKRLRLEAGKKPLMDTGKLRQAAVAVIRDRGEG